MQVGLRTVQWNLGGKRYDNQKFPMNQIFQTQQLLELTKEEMLSILNNAMNAEYEAYVDEVITDPLIEKMPKKGKIKKTTQSYH